MTRVFRLVVVSRSGTGTHAGTGTGLNPPKLLSCFDGDSVPRVYSSERRQRNKVPLLFRTARPAATSGGRRGGELRAHRFACARGRLVSDHPHPERPSRRWNGRKSCRCGQRLSLRRSAELGVDETPGLPPSEGRSVRAWSFGATQSVAHSALRRFREIDPQTPGIPSAKGRAQRGATSK